MKHWLIAAHLVLAVFIAGCGGADDTTAPPPGGSSTTTIELFANEKDLWQSTNVFRDDVCIDCDTYELTWELEGWTTNCTFDYKWEQCFSDRDAFGKPCFYFYNPVVGYEIEIIPHFDLSPYSEVTLSWQSVFDNNGLVAASISPDGTTWTSLSEYAHKKSGTFERSDFVELTRLLGSANTDVRIRFAVYAGVYNLNCSRHNDFCSGSNRFRAAVRQIKITGKRKEG